MRIHPVRTIEVLFLQEVVPVRKGTEEESMNPICKYAHNDERIGMCQSVKS